MEHTIIVKLENIKSKCNNKLMEQVIDDALEHNEHAQSWLEDVQQHGCQSGCVSSLIYYSDTHKFFLEYIDQIEEAFFEYGEQIGEQPKIPEGDIRNWFAWFGYEWTVSWLLNDLENYDVSEYSEQE